MCLFNNHSMAGSSKLAIFSSSWMQDVVTSDPVGYSLLKVDGMSCLQYSECNNGVRALWSQSVLLFPILRTSGYCQGRILNLRYTMSSLFRMGWVSRMDAYLGRTTSFDSPPLTKRSFTCVLCLTINVTLTILCRMETPSSKCRL